MNIKIGSTRFVLLTRKHAIKIARIRPARFISRLLPLLLSKNNLDHFLLKYGPGFGNAIKRDIFAGVYSNRNEYEYYQKYQDSRCAPTENLLFAGLIVTQPRGADVFFLEDIGIPAFVNGQKTEADSVDQFKRIGNNVLLVDYGRASTVIALRSTITPKT